MSINSTKIYITLKYKNGNNCLKWKISIWKLVWKTNFIKKKNSETCLCMHLSVCVCVSWIESCCVWKKEGIRKGLFLENVGKEFDATGNQCVCV